MEQSYDGLREACRASMKDLLGIDTNTDDVSFFALGGTSSAAIRWMLDIAERTGLDVDLADIFDSPSPADLAFVLHERTNRSAAGSSITGPWHPASEKQALRLEAARYSRTGGVPLTNAGAEILVLGLALRGPLDTSCLSRAVEAVIERHELLRARFDLDGPPYRLAISQPSFGLERWAGDDLSELYQPFTFNSGQLARFVLVERRRDSHELWTAVEHVAADQDSMYLLLVDLATYYNRLVRGESLGTIAHDGVSGALVGEHEAAQASSPAGLQSRELYRDQLGDGPPWRPLEGTHVHQPHSAAIDHLNSTVTLSQSELQALHQRCASESASLTAAIVHSASTSLYQVLGVSDLTVYCVVGNRSSQLSETVAPLASVVPIRIQQRHAHAIEQRRYCFGQVNRSLARTAYHFDRFAREHNAWGAHQELPVVIVNIFVQSALDPFDLDGLDVQEIPAHSAVPDKSVVTFQVDYDSDALNLTMDSPTGLMSTDDAQAVVDTITAELRGVAT